jgi:aldose 1-epimerase
MPYALLSGEQIELRAGEQRVVVAEVGAGLRSYAVGDQDVLDGYAADELATSGRGQVLAPWPNRIEGGTYEFGGTQHQLPLNEVEARNAIHGLVRWSAWSASEHSPDRVVLEHTLHPQPGYPFSLALGVEYSLSQDGLRVTSTATNIGPEACPYGFGMHPYLTLGTKKVDQLILRAPGRTVLKTNDRGIPVGSEPVEGTEYDFRRPRPIGMAKLDHAFTDLERGDDGLASVELLDPEDERSLLLWLDDGYRYLQLFTGDPLPDVARRSLAVEPMTCAPNAFRTGDGLLVLEPGETTTSSWGIRA